jgi:hypothetical protein
MGGYTRAFPGNGSVNTFPLLGSRFLIMQQLDHNNGKIVFSLWSVPRCYTQGAGLDSVDSSERESVKIGLQPGGRGIGIVGAVTRKRLITDCVL